MYLGLTPIHNYMDGPPTGELPYVKPYGKAYYIGMFAAPTWELLITYINNLPLPFRIGKSEKTEKTEKTEK